MSWQALLVTYLFLSTSVSLIRRKLGKELPQHNRLVNAISLCGFHLVLGVIAAQVIGYDLAVGWVTFFLIFFASAVFPITSMMAYRASKNVDAGLFSVLETLNPVVTIVLAIALLSESLSIGQSIGSAIILLSAFFASLASYKRARKSTRLGIVIALLAIALTGAATIYEKWALDEVSLGTYFIIGWGSQAFWMLVFAWPERRNLRKVLSKKYRKYVVGMALIRGIKGFVFLAALNLTSAALLGSFISFLPVIVVVTSYFVLHEKNMLGLKIATAITGSIGLLILNLS